MSNHISKVQERAALDDVEHRAWVLRKGMWDYMKLLSAQVQHTPSPTTGYNLDQRRLNSEADRELENILLNAKHWYKAISRSAIPREIRKAIRQTIDSDLKRTVEHLRDIREHWEQTRQYFEDPSISVPPSQSKVLWFKETYPDANPWSSGMSVGIGYYIAGPEVLNLHNLLVEADRVDAILKSEKP